MTPGPADEPAAVAELRPLLDALCEDAITPDQLRRLEELVLGSPEAEAHYLRFMAFYADLIGHVAGLPQPAAPPPQPVEEPPVTTPKPAPRPAKPRRARWWAAAAVLVAVGAAAYPVAGWASLSREAARKRDEFDRAQAELNRLRAEQDAADREARRGIDEAAAAEQKLRAEHRAALEAARKAIEEKEFTVRVTGPERVQPGAPNRWQIETLRRGAVGRPERLEVAVKDSAGTELFREAHDKPVGVAALNLPADFWAKVKPGADLFLEVSTVSDDRRSVLADRLPLARPVYVTHLVTDKPLYKPGEVVRFRSLTLDRATLKPPAHELHLKFRLRDPGDAPVPVAEGNGRLVAGTTAVNGPDGSPLRGIGVGEYALPGEAPGGEYKLDLLEVNTGTGAEVLIETRKFLVNRYVPDVFEKKLEFDGKSYGPGDVVQAQVEVSRTAGGPMKDATATVVAAADGKPFYEKAGERFAVKDGKAVLNVRFTVPAAAFEKDAPNATLSVKIADGSDAEAIVRPIPLVTKTLAVSFFPEGGEMVAGVPGRVYVQVRTPHGKPADLRGTVTDGAEPVADVATLTDAENPGANRGHGVFTLTPRAGAKYFLKLASPVGITPPTPAGFPLPDAKADGVALTALDAVTAKGVPVRVRVQSPTAKALHVGAYVRERLVSQKRVEVEAGKPVDVVLAGDDAAGGVVRVTVFEEPKAGPLAPRAERLVYRQPAEQLVLGVTPDKPRYAPGGKVKLDLAAATETGAATPAVLLVGVVNRSVVTMADNKTDRLLPTHFFLSGDVREPAELEHADFLLTDHPKAAVALDLLLGTQGWRRFVEQTGAPQNPADKPAADRMLVAHGQRPSAPLELFKLEERRVTAEFAPKIGQTRLTRTLAEAAWNEARGAAGAGIGARVAAANTAVGVAYSAQQTASRELADHARQVTRWAVVGVAALVVVGLVGGLVLLTRAAFNPQGRPVVRVGAGVGAVLLCGVVAVMVLPAAPKVREASAPGGRGLDLWDDEAKSARVFREAQGDMAPRAAPMARGPADFNRLQGIRNGVRGVESEIPQTVDAEREGEKNAEKKVTDDLVGSPDKLLMALKGKKAPPARKPADARSADGTRAVHGRLDRLQDRIAGEPDAGMPAPGPGMLDLESAEGRFRERGFARPSVLDLPPFVVREYAHRRDPALGDVRADFTETVFWHPVLVLPGTGKASVEFQLSDDIARYQVLVAGHTADGRIGAVTHTLEARKPFSVDPKLPLEIAHTDTIDVPMRVTNDGDDPRTVGFNLTPHGLKIDGAARGSLDLGPNGKGRAVVRLKADKLEGDAGLMVEGSSGRDKDAVARFLAVVPDGFPGVGSFSDTLEKRAAGRVVLPKDVVPGTLKVRLEVYPTSLSDLVKGLDGLLREPYGCFEQTSTTNYPNTLILDYLNQTNQANPAAAARAKDLLAKGYGRLVGFECPDTPTRAKQGFEWFGAADQQHEALTAYGLLQFKDMARVSPVDPELIRRTQAYLLSRRDGTGGFHQNSRALHSWGAAKHVVNAYIVWALAESDPDDAEKMDLRKEVDAIKTLALDENSAGGKDSYFVALAANVMLLRGEREAAHRLLDRLKEKQKDGAVTGAVTSVVQSGGRDLEIETTALTLLGWLRANDPSYATAVKAATKWVSQQRGGYGGFGSTQSTILALKALTLHAKKSAHPAEAGEVKILVGGKEVAARKFTEQDVEVIGLDVPNAEAAFAAGRNEVEVVTDAKQAYPFAVAYTYTTLTPVSAEKCAVAVSTKLSRGAATEGETVPLAITLENRRQEGTGMAVAVVGLPAGLKVPTDLKQLTALREQGRVDFFETRGRELVLYWRSLTPGQKVELSVGLVADVPGIYRGPASRAYLYYDADHKHWVPPLAVTIAPLPAEAAAR